MDQRLNSFRDLVQIDEAALLKITEECLSEAFTCDRLDVPKEPLKQPTLNEIDYNVRSLKNET
jgi:hypothetical protein